MSNQLDPDQQEAKALGSALSQLSRNSGNNPVYLVKIEDPEKKPKIRRFFSLKKPIYDSSSVNFQGFEIQGKVDETKLISREGVVSHIKENESKSFDMIIPWHRVVCIENLFYQAKL